MFGLDVDVLPTRYGSFHCLRKDSIIGKSLRLYGEWAQVEIETFSSFFEDDGVIFDVGANIGTHSVAFSHLKPQSTVIALEPQPLAFGLLSANILSTGSATVRPFNFAAGARRHLVNFVPDYDKVDYNIGGVSMLGAAPLGRGESAIPTTVVPLDSIPTDRPVRFIKIDVEGMEPDVLRGALGLIGRDRPVIFFEVLNMEVLRACRRLLQKLDYDLRWLETPAFNPANFLNYQENIWSWGEVGVIAFPNADSPHRAALPAVTGREKKPPLLKFVP